MKLKKPCTGTMYKIDGKYYCVGEKLSKKGKPTIYTSKKRNKKNKTRKNKK
jgi:hypothetical protein